MLSSSPMKHKIYLGLGGNTGDRFSFFEQAIIALSSKLTDIRVSKIYESAAWGFKDQPDFLNGALEATTDLPQLELLAFAKGIEHELGRRPNFVNGPREIDIDLLLFDDESVDSGKLRIPHSGLLKRSFVLQPMVDLNPEMIPPGSTQSLIEILNKFDAGDLHPEYERQIDLEQLADRK